MKKIIGRMMTCVAVIGVLAGCRVGSKQYRADALVEIRSAPSNGEQSMRTEKSISSGDGITQQVLDSEVGVVLALAKATIGSSEKADAVNLRGTRLIQISVTAPNPQLSADVCNQIAENYTLLTNGAILRLLLEKAVVRQGVSGRSSGEGAGDKPHHYRASNAPTISHEELQIVMEADRLCAAGDRTNALAKYKQVLRIRPNLGEVQMRVNELTRETDPCAWFQQHPEDFGAWMSVFAKLVNSGALDEANEHLKKLPAGHDPEPYRSSIKERRHAIEMNKKPHE